MRLCTSLSPCLAAAALILTGPAHADSRPLDAGSRPVDAGARSVCAGPDDRHFPISSRIHGGPDRYTAGGGYGTFSIDLTNTTSVTCAAIHPVVVLVDAKRALKAGQARLDFYDGSRPHPVRFETTDQAELVGPFDAGLPGFTVGPRKTVTVKARLAITSDAVANEVTANAAVVQRHDDDGDWVGQSDDYRFRIDSGTVTAPGTVTTPGTVTAPGTATPETGPPATATSTTASLVPTPTPSHDDPTLADELARTGLTTPLGVITATALLLAAGGTLVLTWRRR
ncbi:hypothetical protein [Streptomyces anandii]|uniref:hypothetical protein n=1 Tax=Streptomyces anandii TaxID=285454 RepID=UPI0016786965|nr:hypothetical protein [Streptomyces anandii]GGX86890.1 hypothetical protein GCM10010510_35080 [Streptomyces anandii JCM 4720]